ncbi:hypothetical protein GCM10010358_80540 [Streptomyces minutiscleroticus]|uniref:Guanylate cyclase domain-containing protein n=1 Tax=Streptomyces minutiscleroticus TaxID=68238 RepID=A0A918P3H7_9ACTN|nr:hypothetical protein [Streptomyces minutiscleroticus]GGY16827.1 hypothetical protein GCM10010358_80540 [Streptomyces minutiscleroticus]
MVAPLPEQTQDVPAELALLAIDMEKYSQIPEAGMDAVRCDVDDILTTVLAECQLPALDELPGYKDSGDGGILLFPASLLARLVDPLLGRLDAALQRYRRQQLTDSPLVRLRVSVHVGPLSVPRHRGDAINATARLLNSQAVREALAAAGDSGGFLAAALSEIVYQRTVQAGRTPGLGKHHFLEAVARVSDKPDFEQPCRIHVPNLTGPAVRPYLTDALPLTPAPAAPEPAEAAPSAGSRGGTFNFHGQVSDATITDYIHNMRIDRRQR